MIVNIRTCLCMLVRFDYTYLHAIYLNTIYNQTQTSDATVISGLQQWIKLS